MKLLPLSILIICFMISCTSKPTSSVELKSTVESVEPPVLSSNVSTAKMPADPSQFPYAVALKDKNKIEQKSYEVLGQQDKPTVMLFWLTTCGPCAREIKALRENYELWQKDTPFHLVAMSMDREENYPAFIDRVASEQWQFAAYWDFNREFKALMPGHLNGLPQTFIFDKKGKLTWSKRGYLPGDEFTFFEKIKEAVKS